MNIVLLGLLVVLGANATVILNKISGKATVYLVIQDIQVTTSLDILLLSRFVPMSYYYTK
jgi:hypothetical protein